jgi:hypothetical protein
VLLAALLSVCAPSVAFGGQGGVDIVLESKSGSQDSASASPVPTSPTPRMRPASGHVESSTWSVWLRHALSLLFGEKFRFFGPAQP